MMAQWSRLLAWRLVRWLVRRRDTLSGVPEVSIEGETPECRNKCIDSYLDGVNVGIDVGEGLAKAHWGHVLREFMKQNL